MAGVFSFGSRDGWRYSLRPMWFQYKVRLALLAIIIPIALIVAGGSELIACSKTLLGPREVPFAEVSERGLAGRGYVRITGAELNAERGIAIYHKDQWGTPTPWEGVYVPVASLEQSDAPAKYRAVAFIPDARTWEDVAAEAEQDGVTGFVTSEFRRINPGHQQIVKNMAGADSRLCWVMTIRHPSWLKALGCLVGSLVIPGAFVAYKLKNPM
jgi:hypothetical protein